MLYSPNPATYFIPSWLRLTRALLDGGLGDAVALVVRKGRAAVGCWAPHGVGVGSFQLDVGELAVIRDLEGERDPIPFITWALDLTRVEEK